MRISDWSSDVCSSDLARVSTWLMGIAYRCGLKALRRQGDESIDDAVLPELECGVDPNEDRELRDLLNRALQHLGADQRVIIELVYGVGHSLDEVAAILQCPVGTVKARLFHARVDRKSTRLNSSH